jgi:hypothetical protein
VLHGLCFLAAEPGARRSITRHFYPLVAQKPCCAVTFRACCEPLPFLACISPYRCYRSDAHWYVRFGPGSGTSHNTVYSNDTSNPTPAPLSTHFSSLQQNFQTGLSGSVVYPQSGSSFFPSNQPNYYVPDIKPAVRYHSSDIRPISGYPNSPEVKPYLGS